MHTFKVGDKVEYISDNGMGCDAIIGNKYIITSIDSGDGKLVGLNCSGGTCANIYQLRKVSNIHYLGGE